MPGQYFNTSLLQNGKKKGDVAMNSTYWAPFPAHDTRVVQELVMGLINSKAQKVDLNMAPGTKHCEYARKCM